MAPPNASTDTPDAVAAASTARSYRIRVPASTANLGPGFDVLGAAIAIHLIVGVSIPSSNSPPPSHPITISYSGEDASSVSLDPSKNLITRIARFVAAAHGLALPPGLAIHVTNPIPLGRGLGSSGAAIVAGIALANVACDLDLTHAQMLDFATLVEGHPDNVSASIVGGLVTSFLKYDISAETERLRVDDTCYADRPDLPTHLGGIHSSTIQPSSSSAPQPDVPRPRAGGVAIHRPLTFSPRIRVVVGIPHFELPTHLARSVLPKSYPLADVVFNMQRIAMLVHALGDADPDPAVISQSVRDRVHQTQRQQLVPGLTEALSLTDADIPGILGVCLSGAGPTVLALATHNFDAIGQRIVDIFAHARRPDGSPVESHYLVVDFDRVGLVIEPVSTQNGF